MDWRLLWGGFYRDYYRASTGASIGASVVPLRDTGASRGSYSGSFKG